MFGSIGWGEILVLVLVGLFVLGPERLPEGAAWLGRTVRQVKDYATGARDQIRSELGPEFDELRKPLEDLRSVRDLNPRTAVRRQLFDSDGDLLRDSTSGNGHGNGHRPSTGPSSTGPDAAPRQRPLDSGERPPYDSDAT
ncbi:Sec-independent protein translocase protein TatB [Salinifilum aidingensis]